MRVATWNVNSLRARAEKLEWWIERAAPDVLLLQETKVTDADVPRDLFARLGYEVAHHGEGRWNGVAIASRLGLGDTIANFGEPERVAARSTSPDGEPLAEARMISAVAGGIRFVCVYAPNGRVVGSAAYAAKLTWYEHLLGWLARTRRPDELLVLGGDLNVAPDDRDVWDSAACHGGTHVSPPERDAFARLVRWGLVDGYRARREEGGRYTWWDYRAGDFYKNFGMRIDHLLVTPPLVDRIVLSEIDREARKGKP